MPHKDPEKRRAYMRRWSKKRREEDPEFVARNNQASRDHQRRKRQADPEAAYRYKRDHQLKSQFGISLNDYEKILESQGGVCAICKERPEETLAVDHCHSTGIIRGLLCASCNNGLGRFKDDPELLVAAIDYLSIEEDLDPPNILATPEIKNRYEQQQAEQIGQDPVHPKFTHRNDCCPSCASDQLGVFYSPCTEGQNEKAFGLHKSLPKANPWHFQLDDDYEEIVSERTSMGKPPSEAPTRVLPPPVKQE